MSVKTELFQVLCIWSTLKSVPGSNQYWAI